jgi:hypothetical protein
VSSGVSVGRYHTDFKHLIQLPLSLAALGSRSGAAIAGLGVLEGWHGCLDRDHYAGCYQFDTQLAGSSPIWEGSEVRLRSGMALQIDIIPATCRRSGCHWAWRCGGPETAVRVARCRANNAGDRKAVPGTLRPDDRA